MRTVTNFWTRARPGSGTAISCSAEHHGQTRSVPTSWVRCSSSSDARSTSGLRSHPQPEAPACVHSGWNRLQRTASGPVPVAGSLRGRELATGVLGYPPPRQGGFVKPPVTCAGRYGETTPARTIGSGSFRIHQPLPIRRRAVPRWMPPRLRTSTRWGAFPGVTNVIIKVNRAAIRSPSAQPQLLSVGSALFPGLPPRTETVDRSRSPPRSKASSYAGGSAVQVRRSRNKRQHLLGRTGRRSQTAFCSSSQSLTSAAGPKLLPGQIALVVGHYPGVVPTVLPGTR